jgi:hypothetical protein
MQSFTTVVQKLNTYSHPENGQFRFRVSFFGSFLDKQKRTSTVPDAWNNYKWRWIGLKILFYGPRKKASKT